MRDCSLNLKFDNTDSQHREDLRKATWHGAAIIGLQEVQTPAVVASVHTFRKHHPEWDVFGLGTECPILYRRDKMKLTPGSVDINRMTAGEPDVNPARVLVGGHFVDVMGNPFWYYNTHTEQQFTPEYKGDPKYDIRVQRAQQCFIVMRKVMDALGDQTFRMGGDLNISLTSHAMPWYPGNDFPKRLTFDTRLGLDHIGWHNATLSNARAIPCNSDHKMRLVDVSFR